MTPLFVDIRAIMYPHEIYLKRFQYTEEFSFKQFYCEPDTYVSFSFILETVTTNRVPQKSTITRMLQNHAHCTLTTLVFLADSRGLVMSKIIKIHVPYLLLKNVIKRLEKHSDNCL